MECTLLADCGKQAEQKLLGDTTQQFALVLMLILSVLAIPISIMVTYQSFYGHAEVLKGVDDNLSASWYSLWKWYLGFTLGVFGVLAIFVAIMMDPFSMLFKGGEVMMILILAAASGLVIVAVIQLVKLYRTAQIFRNLVVEINAEPSLPAIETQTDSEKTEQDEEQN